MDQLIPNNAGVSSAEQIALAVLDTHAGPWYVAGNSTMRERVLHSAAQKIAPMIAEIEQKAADRAGQNPS